MKRMKKALAIVLSLSLVFTMAVPSFAGSGAGSDNYIPTPTRTYPSQDSQGEPFNYLALGDSMTNGYGLESYEDVPMRGFNVATEGCYPAVLAEKLSGELGKTVNLYQYAFTSLRAEDVLAILSDDPDDETYFGGDAYTDLFIKIARVIAFDDNSNYHYGAAGNFEQLQKDYIGAVKNADLISMNIGMNTFTCMFFERLAAWTLPDPVPEDYIKEFNGLRWYQTPIGLSTGRNAYDYEDVLSGTKLKIFEGAKDGVFKLVGKVMGEDNATGQYVTMIADDLLYSLVSFLNGYDKLTERIYALNPDAEVAFIGFPDALRNIKATFDINGKAITLDMAKLVGVIFNAANLYIRYQQSTYKGDSFYVDYDGAGQIIEDLAQLEMFGTVETTDENNKFKDYLENMLLDGICEFPFNLMGQGIIDTVVAAQSPGGADGADGNETNPTDFTKENIVRGVKYIQAAEADRVAEDAAYEFTGQVYLGIRAQLINELKNHEKYETLDLVGLVGALKNGNFDIDIDPESVDINAGDIPESVQKLLDSDSGITGLAYFYMKMAMLNGYISHTSKQGHIDEANKINEAYKAFLNTKSTKNFIRKAVPVIVGGVAVTFITVAAAKIIKNGIDSGQIAIDPNLRANLQNVFSRAKELLNLTLLNLRSSRTLTFKYI